MSVDKVVTYTIIAAVAVLIGAGFLYGVYITLESIGNPNL